MRRYGRAGWFGESHRHKLASRGISTTRYFSDKQGFMDKNKLTVAGNLPSAELRMREAVANRKEQEIQKMVMDATDNREVDSLSTSGVWNEFEKEKEFYMQNGDKEQFEREVDRKVKSHLRSNNRSLNFDKLIEAD